MKKTHQAPMFQVRENGRRLCEVETPEAAREVIANRKASTVACYYEAGRLVVTSWDVQYMG